MRKKHLYYLIVFLFIIFAILPWIAGIYFQQNLERLLEAVNTDKRLRIELIDYQRGWFTSQATIRLTILEKDIDFLRQLNISGLTPSSDIVLLFQEDIKHGPIIYDNKRLTLGYADIHSSLLTGHSKKDILRINIFTAFNNRWLGEFETSAWSFTLPYINRFNVEKLKGNFYFKIEDKAIKHIKINNEIGPISIEFDEKNPHLKQITILTITGKYDAAHSGSNLWSGLSSLYTPGMAITDIHGANFVFEKVAITNTFSVSGNILYNLNVAVFVKNLVSLSHTIPAFSKMQIIFSAQNFNAKGLNDYIEFIRSKTPEELKDINLQTFDTLLAHTISTNSIFSTSVDSDTSLGSFSILSKTVWPENTALPNSINDIIKGSYTTILLKMSDALVMKLLEIYGDQITASNQQLQEIQKKTQQLENENFQNQQASKQTLLQRTVDLLVKQNQLKSDVSLQILSMAQQKQSLEVFSRNIDQLNLPEDIKKMLKLTYHQQMDETETVVLNAKQEELLKNLIAIGYLRKDLDNKDQYISNIIIKDGVINISGAPLLDTPNRNPF